MYAIVETGGKQYRVKPGDTIAVERIAGEPGEVLDLDRVLLVSGSGDNTTPRVGSPGVDGAIVRAEVVEHARGEKVIVFRYKSKVRYRRKTGHRQALTRLRITDILLDGESAVRASEAEPAAPPLAVAEAPQPAEAEEETAPVRPRRRRAAEEDATAESTEETPSAEQPEEEA